MELKWLEDFISLAATSSFSRSAEERHVTQSAFSRRIKQLETWLGVPLVDRATFPARLTRAGESFLPVARDTVRQMLDSRDRLREEHGLRAGTLSFAALHTLSVAFFPRWLHEVAGRFGEVDAQLSADQSGMEAFVHSLSEGESDFLLTYYHPSVPLRMEPDAFGYAVLGRERILPVSAPDAKGRPLHRIDKERPVRYLGYATGSFVGAALAHLFVERPLPRTTVYRNSMSEGLKAMALEGWGLAWVPEGILGDELADGRLVTAGDASWSLDVEIRLYRSLANTRPVVARFWECVTAGS
jgi:DNA-binding transcriptional LysR family regulator